MMTLLINGDDILINLGERKNIQLNTIEPRSDSCGILKEKNKIKLFDPYMGNDLVD